MGNWFSKDKRGLLMGIWCCNANFGTIMGMQICHMVVFSYKASWENCFVITGFIFYSFGLCNLLFLNSSPEEAGYSSALLKPSKQ